MSKTYGDNDAYPTQPILLGDGTFQYGTPGLTKRELFAAMAMQGILSNSNERFAGMRMKEIAHASVESADDLIAALNMEKPDA